MNVTVTNMELIIPESSNSTRTLALALSLRLHAVPHTADCAVVMQLTEMVILARMVSKAQSQEQAHAQSGSTVLEAERDRRRRQIVLEFMSMMQCEIRLTDEMKRFDLQVWLFLASFQESPCICTAVVSIYLTIT